MFRSHPNGAPSSNRDSPPSPRDLPPLHDVLRDVFLQTPRSSSPVNAPSRGSVRTAPWFLQSHPLHDQQGHGFPERGPQLAPISPSRSSWPPSSLSRRQPSRSAPSTPSPQGSPSRQRTTAASHSHPKAPTTATPAHSYDLFNYSPDRGLVHQRSSKSQDDLEESRPKPRASSVDDIARKYICSECGKRFAKPSTLRNHIMTHTGEKPFVCPHPHCGRRFSIASNMQRHLRTHASGSAFETVYSGDEDE